MNQVTFNISVQDESFPDHFPDHFQLLSSLAWILQITSGYHQADLGYFRLVGVHSTNSPNVL